MASKKADKSYPPGQKPSAMPAKPTMAQAFNAAQGPAINRPIPGPGSAKPTPSYFPKGNSSSKPKDTRSAAQRIVQAAMAGPVKASMKPGASSVPPKESADITAQKKAANTKANAARMANDLAVGAKVVKKAAAAATSTGSAAKPYVKLKQPAREAARRAYVQKQLDRLGIKPAKAGAPRSAEEKAARVKARATWDKKNPFKPKSGK